MIICARVEVGTRATEGQSHLVIDIRDVHDEVDIVTEVVRHDAPQDVLSHIVSALHNNKPQNPVYKRVERLRTSHVPYAMHHKLWVRNCTTSQSSRRSARILPGNTSAQLSIRPQRKTHPAQTLLRVNELYTFSTGVSVFLTGTDQAGCCADMAVVARRRSE